MASATLTTRSGALPAEDAMGISRSSLDRPLEGDAELSVIDLTTEATVLGAFQRHHDVDRASPIARRISGGPAVRVGSGTLHVLLALRRPGALVACDARHIVNRYVRPLLHALTKCGALAHYFGRDWVSVARRPVGQVGFAHDSTTGRAVFEAFIAVSTPYASPGRASFLGKEPTTLEAVTGRVFDRSTLQARVADAYATEYDRAPQARDLEDVLAMPDDSGETWDDPPWHATVDEAIGVLAAGVDASGKLCLGGEILASRDALARVAAKVAALPRGEADASRVGALVDEELSPSSVALDGVRDLTHVRDVLLLAHAGA